MRRPKAIAEVLRFRAAERLASFDLVPDDRAIGAEVLLPLVAAVQLELVAFGPKGLLELAAACTQLAAERGLARNLAEDALCALAVARLPPSLPAGSDETVKLLRGLTPWALLDGDLEAVSDEEAAAAGEWLATRVLPASRPGRFPLRKLLLRPLTSLDLRDPVPRLAVLGQILAPVAARGFDAHVVDLFECYCGWMETSGRCDAHVQLVLRRLQVRDVESERRREGLAAAVFFGVLARLDPALTSEAPRLHRELLWASRELARRFPEATR